MLQISSIEFYQNRLLLIRFTFLDFFSASFYLPWLLLRIRLAKYISQLPLQLPHTSPLTSSLSSSLSLPPRRKKSTWAERRRPQHAAQRRACPHRWTSPATAPCAWAPPVAAAAAYPALPPPDVPCAVHETLPPPPPRVASCRPEPRRLLTARGADGTS